MDTQTHRQLLKRAKDDDTMHDRPSIHGLVQVATVASLAVFSMLCMCVYLLLRRMVCVHICQSFCSLLSLRSVRSFATFVSSLSFISSSVVQNQAAKRQPSLSDSYS